MSFPLLVNTPMVTLSVIAEDAGGGSRLTWSRTEVREKPQVTGLACPDILKEIRARMGRLGYQWE